MYPGENRNRCLSSILGASTIFPGLNIPYGSIRDFTSLKAFVNFSPNIIGLNSEREIPSPCSPECDPSNFFTSSNASSAIARILITSLLLFIFRMGLTCRHPTDACAYHVPDVSYFSKISFNP